jgi:hypothetical protein
MVSTHPWLALHPAAGQYNNYIKGLYALTGRRMHGAITAAAPTAITHQTPITNARRSMVGIVEVRPSEN